MKLLKKKIKLWLFVFFVCAFGLLIIVFAMIAAISGAVNTSAEQQVEDSLFQLSEAVEAYRDDVTRIARQQNAEKWVNHILAIMEVSTQGEGADVMLAGGFSRNTRFTPREWGSIREPLYSIEVGIGEFRALLSRVGVENEQDTDRLLIVYQTYHFNRGFIDYANENNGYSPEVALSYMNTQREWNRNINFALDVDFILSKIITTGTGNFIYPLARHTTITSPYGMRWRWWDTPPQYGHHDGVDFAAPAGTPVMAIADGTVTAVGWNGGYGISVTLQHSPLYSSMYAHLSRAAVSNTGVFVRQGDVIGYVGTTGSSTGNHLHLEIWVGGRHTDPAPLLGAMR